MTGWSGLFCRVLCRKLGFDQRWVKLAMEIVTTTSYSVFINGEPKGWITQTRGIRQGDPLSPYLFLLCAEGLSALLNSQRRIVWSMELCLAKMGCASSTFYLQTIVYYFAKPRLESVNNYWAFLAKMRQHWDKQSTVKKLPCFLARTQISK